MIFKESNLNAFFDKIYPDFAQEDDPTVNLELAKYCLSFEIIKKATSVDWIYDYLKNTDKSDKYLFQREKQQDTLEFKKHRTRIFLFAEMLYNLQFIPGIQDVFKKFGKEDFESIFIELEFAKYIYRSGRYFRFNTPVGIKGQDFDIIIEINNNEAVGEIKSKLESNDFAPKKIIQTIKDAKKQLPSNQQNLIFIKIPEIWGQDEQKMDVLCLEIKNYIDKSERILTIIFLWNIWVVQESGDFILYILTQEVRNTHSELENVKYPNNLFTALIDLGKQEPWFDILTFIKQKLNLNTAYGI